MTYFSWHTNCLEMWAVTLPQLKGYHVLVHMGNTGLINKPPVCHVFEAPFLAGAEDPRRHQTVLPEDNLHSRACKFWSRDPIMGIGGLMPRALAIPNAISGVHMAVRVSGSEFLLGTIMFWKGYLRLLLRLPLSLKEVIDPVKGSSTTIIFIQKSRKSIGPVSSLPLHIL